LRSTGTPHSLGEKGCNLLYVHNKYNRVFHACAFIGFFKDFSKNFFSIFVSKNCVEKQSEKRALQALKKILAEKS
jgi:hypothetical protein